MKRSAIAVITAAIVASTAITVFAGSLGKAYIPDITTEKGPGVNMEESENLVEKVENPVKYFGYIKNIDKDNDQILFNAMGYTLNEDKKPVETKTDIILKLDKGTPIIDAVSGSYIMPEEIDKNAAAYAWTSPVMTRSMPGQTNACALVVNIPADFAAPLYVVVNDIQKDEDGNYRITDQDGAEFAFAGDIKVEPYMTRNIVKLEDIKKGSRCVIYIGPAVALRNPPIYFAEKIILFAE